MERSKVFPDTYLDSVLLLAATRAMGAVDGVAGGFDGENQGGKSLPFGTIFRSSQEIPRMNVPFQE